MQAGAGDSADPDLIAPSAFVSVSFSPVPSEVSEYGATSSMTPLSLVKSGCFH